MAAPAAERQDDSPLFLFSVDLEDIRQLMPDGDRYRERVPANAERFLAFLARFGARCTFFCTGDVARRYPDVVRRLVEAGHEIASHTSEHLPLDRQTPASLRDDLLRCRDDFAAAGAPRCIGFRAPIGSLTAETRWAYDVLAELGFVYSTSVIAAKNPLYGWPEYGPNVPRRMNGVWEIPISLSGLPGLNVPFAGGVYFRVLPFPLVRRLFRRELRRGLPVHGYAHAHDIDAEQERFPHPEVRGSRFYSWLMYRNRRHVLPRIERLLEEGFAIVRYDEFVARTLEPAGGAAG